MDKLSLGMQIDIMRSDGRIHGAIISSIQYDTKSVSVEWYEKGETKGKEVDINALMKSNPKIYPLPAQTNDSKINQKREDKSHQKRNVQQLDKIIHEPTITKSNRQKEKRLSSIDENSTTSGSNKNSIAPYQNMFSKQHETSNVEIDEMDKISVGMNVNIQRSNGRIQGAMITQINCETRTVGVEWFEMGETKGKDVDLKSLIRNNPDLFTPSPMSSNFMSVSTSKNNNSIISGSKTERQRQRYSNANISQPQPLPSIMDTTRSLDDFDDNDLIVNDSLQFIERRRTKIVNSSAWVTEKPVVSKLPDIFEEDIPAPDFQNNIKENEPTIIEPPQVVNRTRKTLLLSNIEELERNRELRRAQQEEARKQRDIQMQIDPGNPNWEFLSMIRDYRATLDFRPLDFNDSIVDNRICVCVRKRPFGKKEFTNKEVEVVTIPTKEHVIVHQPQVKVDLTKYLLNQKYRFDYAFNESATNELVYRFTAQPLVRNVFQRGFSTCFAYGQTGSGKTHTMGGIIEGRHQDCSNGIYAMTAIDVFTLLHLPEYRNEHLTVSCSFFEIYGTKVFDLLSKKATLRVLEDGRHLVQIVGLREVTVHSVQEVLKLIKIGSDQRSAGQTSANSNSSRSHAVFQIILRRREKNSDVLYGKFSLIDLAGNERGADTISSDRQTRLEGAEINKSLLALKECIRAMGRDEQHVPFRGSKLTLILRDSFVGKNAKTCMIAMISPGISCVENTMNTLRYADRVKELGSELEQPNGDAQMAPSTSNK